MSPKFSTMSAGNPASARVRAREEASATTSAKEPPKPGEPGSGRRCTIPTRRPGTVRRLVTSDEGLGAHERLGGSFAGVTQPVLVVGHPTNTESRPVHCNSHD